jgi:hypothetical protein
VREAAAGWGGQVSVYLCICVGFWGGEGDGRFF